MRFLGFHTCEDVDSGLQDCDTEMFLRDVVST
jgi:hypothetical protein